MIWKLRTLMYIAVISQEPPIRENSVYSDLITYLYKLTII